MPDRSRRWRSTEMDARSARLPGSTPCKICGARAAWFGMANFNKNCEERRGLILPPHAEFATYFKCENCATIFTTDFDHWSREDFARNIYNEEYALIDVDVLDTRPRQNARLIADLVTDRKVSILDYGGHAGHLSRMLAQKGFCADSWDPFSNPVAVRNGYDLIASFEVLEHSIDPIGTVSDMASKLEDGGAILFSTYALDFEPDASIDHWYISPRNGHVTIHSRQGLRILFAKFDMRIHHYSRGLHLALHEGRAVPPWLTRESVAWIAVPGEVLHAPDRS
ncbi:class I SAM-dependent methyltransferase [Burkholderia gladioli]|uniref:class I SAM-dependent methyltransferase n=1 Tax=Burkholderia gladioli TaxID=28095 RepID=UPI00163E072C|nr:class I SAM-dependent methyltransferase [Burkholderia gladioli]